MNRFGESGGLGRSDVHGPRSGSSPGNRPPATPRHSRIPELSSPNAFHGLDGERAQPRPPARVWGPIGSVGRVVTASTRPRAL
ncbi:hypothetical protein FRUB_00412 [Fimbriiglobus ruber]|uniref:Uncharacterized protein n=1 Tax=Fimbriiglobus ruber TaxID=1908690 RepID=A0A225E0I4_9BACT|nr:hypothetical protein FRUB_00412 [Fimbriiglobus ruber]